MPEGPPNLRFDRVNQCLWRSGRRIDLPPKEFALLSALLDQPEQLLGKGDLLRQVWPDTHVGDAVLSVAMAQLRESLGDNPRAPVFIETVHRRGYRWIGGAIETTTPSANALAGGHADLVGRDPELAQLGDALREARRGSRQIVFVTGETGVGKTALIEHFAAALTGVDNSIATGHCIEHFGAGEAYLPVLDAFGRLARQPTEVALPALLRRHAPTWLAQLPFLMSRDDHSRFAREASGGTRERMLREFAAAVEAYSADRTLTLVLEDLHWSDPSTVALLAMLARRRESARLLVIATFRPVDSILGSRLALDLKRQLVGQKLAREITLPALGPDDVATYLGRRFSAAIEAELAGHAYRTTEGNPLFVVSLLEHLIARQILTIDTGEWQLRDGWRSHDEIPETVRHAIDRQLDALPPEEVEVLSAASIVGGEFDSDALVSVIDGDALTLRSRCESLAQRGIFLRQVAASTRSEQRFDFRHTLCRSVLRDRQPLARRLRAHRRVADWLEATGGSAAQVAHHLEAAGAAGDTDRLVSAAQRAAQRARQVFAFDEAIAHFQTALRFVPPGEADPSRRCALMIGLADAEERAGRITTANASYRSAADLGRTAADPRLFARAALGMGRAYQQVGRANDDLIALLEEALLGLPAGELTLHAKVRARLAWALCSVAGTGDRTQGLCREAVAIAHRVDDPDCLAWVAQYTRWSFSGPQSSDELRRGAEQLTALCKRVSDKEQCMMLHVLRATDFLEIGAVEEADQALGDLAALVEETQIPWFRWYQKRIEVTRALLEGRLDDAEQLITASVAAAEGMDHPNVPVLAAGQRVMLRWQQGRVAEIEPLVRFSLEQNPGITAWRAVHACLLVELGEIEQARVQLAELAVDGFARIPHDSVWLNTLAMASLVSARLGDKVRSAMLRRLLAPYAERCVGVGAATFSLGHAQRYLGLLAAAEGDYQAAAKHLAAAIEGNRRVRARPWAAACERDLAALGDTPTRSPSK